MLAAKRMVRPLVLADSVVCGILGVGDDGFTARAHNQALPRGCADKTPLDECPSTD
jgi:hypothetical protein